jgi:putative SOS response-associated peptidase YedK
MCGRLRLTRFKQFLAEHVGTTEPDDDWIPRYNIAPTQNIPVIRQHPPRAQAARLQHAMGSHPLLVEGRQHRREND